MSVRIATLCVGGTSSAPLARTVVAAVLLCAVATPATVSAQSGGPSVSAGGREEEPEAILVSGPEARRSLPFLPVNAITYRRGVYERDGGTVEVLYSEDTVFRRERWNETSCNDMALNLVSQAGPRTLHYTWDDSRHAFFTFRPAGAGGPGEEGAAGRQDAAAGADSAGGAAPAEADAAGAEFPPTEATQEECEFVQAFLERFTFFLDTRAPGAGVPFPAVLPAR